MVINFKEVKAYIRKHLKEIRTIEDVAQHVGCSSETLRKKILEGRTNTPQRVHSHMQN